MTARETKAQLRARQLDAIRDALAEHPGLSVYRLSLAVPLADPEPGSGGLLARPAHVPLTLVISLLKELGGEVREVPDPGGAHWYLTGDRT